MKKILTILSILLLITGCSKKAKTYKINDEINLEGKISTAEIMQDGKNKKVNILNLDSPIIINNTAVHKIELGYDKELKNDIEISLKGIIKDGTKSELNLDYIFEITALDNSMSIVNTFANETFSITIPTEIIDICTVKEIANGFIIYSTNNIPNGGEVLRILSVTNDEFQNLRQNKKILIEKITSNKKNTIITMYPTDNQYSKEYELEYEKIGNSINDIKENIKLK